MTFFHRCVFHCYTLAITLGVLCAVGAPFHQAGTRHANVVEVDPANHRVAVHAHEAVGLEVGDQVPVYRFNPGWKREIGWVEVDAVETDRVWAHYDPAALLFPIGAQGLVTSFEGRRGTVSIGRDEGASVGQELEVFRGRESVAVLRVMALLDDGAEVALKRATDPGIELPGLVTAAYVIPNQLAWFAGGWRSVLEVLAIAGTLGVWLWSVFSATPGRALVAGAARLRAGLGRIGTGGRIAGYALLGVPVVWGGANLAWYGGTHAMWWLMQWGRRFELQVPSVQHWPDWGLFWVMSAFGVSWYVLLAWRRENPLWIVWRALRYRAPDYSRLIPGLTHGQINWVLHILVFWAFASTLHTFLIGNMNAVGSIGWRGAGLQFGTVQGALAALGHMLTHAPTFMTWSEFFGATNLLLFSACICGGLLGYGHTMLTSLFTSSIRNVDFTLMGWFTTMICYGPLLGVVIWRFMPELHGLDPVYTDGPWFWLVKISTVWLNLLYTLSIFNLGKRFGVMVDKGLVDWGFYTVVRHPSYTLESLMFVCMEMVGFTTVGPWIAASVFILEYYFRSEREDDFMGSSNPDYVEYRDRVRWRYIPGVF